MAGSHPFRRMARWLIGALTGVAILLPWPALASEVSLSLTGEPTEAEAVLIESQWGLFSATFGGFEDCMGPIEVKVVARAEDWYSNRDVGPIAAFYRYPPESTVFVEHGKVRPDVLLHEFAHHLDISCGLGNGPTGSTFRDALGLPADRGWTSGRIWSDVPAEVFAEAVVAYFAEPTSISIREAGVAVIEGLGRTLEPEIRERNQHEVSAAVGALRRLTAGEAIVAPPRNGLYAL